MIVSDQVQVVTVAQQFEKALQEQCASSVLSSIYLQEVHGTTSKLYKAFFQRQKFIK